MKKTLFLLGGLLISLATTAQVKTPQLSPKAKIEQTVGLTNFEVEYSRPSLRGRDLYKDILSVGKTWRFGANKNTTLSFDTEINFAGESVDAGTYAVYALVEDKEWRIMLYSGTENWGVPEKWEKEKVVAEIMVPVKTNPNTVETFTMSFDNLDVNNFDLIIEWGNVILPITVKLPTHKLTIASINETMKGEPTERDYYSSASFYLNANIELESALLYIDKAIEMNGDAPFYYIRKKALILKGMGKNNEAINVAKLALDKATAAGSEDHIRMNKESIKEWSKK